MKKLTITVDEDVYNGLYAQIGRGNISSFLNDAARTLMTQISDAKPVDKGAQLLAQMRGKSTIAMSTDEIMRLTRDES